MLRVRYSPSHKSPRKTEVSAFYWNERETGPSSTLQLGAVAAALLPPIAAAALALGLWALAQQVSMAANFPVAEGVLADWRVWIGFAIVVELLAVRIGRGDISDPGSG